MGKAKAVLVLGGNGFLGATFVEEICSLQPSLQVDVLNRGNEYWDSASRISRARQLTCDRDRITSCRDLRQSYDYAVDFSANIALQVTAALDLLAERVALYLLVSTAAVYIPSSPVFSAPLAEEDALLGPALSLGRRLRRRVLGNVDDYARRKLEAEEAAFAFQRLNVKSVDEIMGVDENQNETETETETGSETGSGRAASGGVSSRMRMSVAVLRLPYVVGPRDSTHRLAAFHLWLRTRRPTLPWFAKDALISFIGVRSVSSALRFLAEKAPRHAVEGRAFNAAQPPLCLARLCEILVQTIGQGASTPAVTSLLGSPMAYIYDAVRFAGIFRFALDDTRLRSLGWQPPADEATAEEALQSAAQFVERELLRPGRRSRFPEEQHELAQTFLENVGEAEFQDSLDVVRRTLGLTGNIDAGAVEDEPVVLQIAWTLLSSPAATACVLACGTCFLLGALVIVLRHRSLRLAAAGLLCLVGVGVAAAAAGGWWGQPLAGLGMAAHGEL